MPAGFRRYNGLSVVSPSVQNRFRERNRLPGTGKPLPWCRCFRRDEGLRIRLPITLAACHRFRSGRRGRQPEWPPLSPDPVGSLVSKIVDKRELLRRVAEARADGRSIVHCHGCFDIVHPGHVRYLEFAASQGDLLIVSLTGDSQVGKGVQRPYIPEELRAESLAALAVVDLVYINPHPTACDLLAELQPDVYVKGREYEKSHDPGFQDEQAVIASYGGRVLFSSGDVVFSSTRLIESLDRDSQLEAQRLALMCRRHRLDHSTAAALAGSFANLRVLVIGDVVLDRYVLCDATDLASEAAMMSLSRLEERVYVGGAGIIARHCAGLGASTYLLSGSSREEESVSVRGTFEAESVEAHLIPCRPGLPEKTRFLVDNTKLLRVENGSCHPLDSVAERQAADWIEPLAPRLDAVILCDLGYGTITAGLLQRLQPILSRSDLIVTADVGGPRARLMQFRRASLLCPTERSLRSALHDFESGLSSVAWEALEQSQARHLLVTLGKKGLVVFERQSQDADRPEWRGRLRSEYLPALAGQVVDPLGCGDALLATTTLALAAGGSLMQAAYLGNAAAAVEIATLGNVPLEIDHLSAWLSRRVELAETAELMRGPGAGFGEGDDVLQAVMDGRAKTERRRRLRMGTAMPATSD